MPEKLKNLNQNRKCWYDKSIQPKPKIVLFCKNTDVSYFIESYFIIIFFKLVLILTCVYEINGRIPDFPGYLRYTKNYKSYLIFLLPLILFVFH